MKKIAIIILLSSFIKIYSTENNLSDDLLVAKENYTKAVQEIIEKAIEKGDNWDLVIEAFNPIDEDEIKLESFKEYIKNLSIDEAIRIANKFKQNPYNLIEIIIQEHPSLENQV